MRVHIDVTQEDIDLGQPLSGGNCPIARACNRAGLGPAFVCLGNVYKSKVPPLSQKVLAHLPLAALRFYRHYDESRGGGKPFSFELEIE